MNGRLPSKLSLPASRDSERCTELSLYDGSMVAHEVENDTLTWWSTVVVVVVKGPAPILRQIASG